MKLLKNPLCKLLFFVVAVLFFQIHSLQAQTTFPNPDIQKQLKHEGDLILTGSQIMTIENTNYIINGSIILKDSSQLFIRQSIIDLKGGFGEVGAGIVIRIEGNAFLHADGGLCRRSETAQWVALSLL